MAVLLPILGIVALLRKEDVRESFLDSLTAAGFFVFCATELLSLFHLLSFGPVLALWLLYVVSLVIFRLRGKKGSAPPASPRETPTPLQWCLVVLSALVIALAGVTALVAAPNNLDSLVYHLPRVMHWIQNGSVAHYPTHSERQLIMAPLSEYAILHLQLLAGSDRFANCVQWLALAGSAVGVSLIARACKGSLTSQAVAAALAVSVPMGLLQATSTQNDYTVTFWLVCLVYQVIKSRERSDALQAVRVGIPLALAVFTKGTAYFVAFPFMLIYLWFQLRAAPRRLPVNLLVIAALLLLVNGGLYLRNWGVFHNPISAGNTNDLICTRFDPAALVSDLTKNVATQLTTGIAGADRALLTASFALHKVIGVEASDPNLTANDDFNTIPKRLLFHEDFAPNPAHMLLLFLAALLLCLRWKKNTATVNLLISASLLSFVLLCVCLKWTPFVSRYYLPVFVISAPCVALVCDWAKGRAFISGCAVVLLLWSFVILCKNPMRPLTGPDSVFVTDRTDQYFMANRGAKPYFLAMTNVVKSQPLTTVGLTDTHTYILEYLVWVLLNQGPTKYRIESVGVANASGRIPEPGLSHYFSVNF